MRRLALFALISATLSGPALAQPAPPGPDGPPPALRQRMDEARAGARAAAMNALSSDHQRSVNVLLDQVKSGKITDVHDAAKKIDAVLSPKESQDVLAARDKMISDVHASLSDQSGPDAPGGGDSRGGGPGGGGPGPGGPSQGGPPAGPGGPGFAGPPPGPDGGEAPRYGRHRQGRRAMRNDPGFALLMLSLDPAQMRSLFMRSTDRG